MTAFFLDNPRLDGYNQTDIAVTEVRYIFTYSKSLCEVTDDAMGKNVII